MNTEEERHELITYLKDGGNMDGHSVDKLYDALMHMISYYHGGSVNIHLNITDANTHNSLIIYHLNQFGCTIQIENPMQKIDHSIDWVIKYNKNKVISALYKSACPPEEQRYQLQITHNDGGTLEILDSEVVKYGRS